MVGLAGSLARVRRAGFHALLRKRGCGDVAIYLSTDQCSFQESQRPAYLVGIISGAIAGTVVDFVLFPLDTLKTRLQSGAPVKTGLEILSGIYKGLAPAVLASAPAGAAFFGTYDYIIRLLGKMDSSDRLAPLRHMAAAVGGDITSSAVRVPFEVRTCVLTVDARSFDVTFRLSISRLRLHAFKLLGCKTEAASWSVCDRR